MEKEQLTSEELNGIPPQPKEQCPLIDEVIGICKEESKNIKNCYDNIKDLEGVEDYVSDLDWAEYNLRQLEGNLEQIRTNIEKLRDWGQHWKDLAKELLDKQNINELNK